MPVINFLFFFFILVIDPIRYRQLNPHNYYPCPGVPICNGHGICENGICHCLHGHTGNGCEIPPYGYVIDNPCHADPICNGHGSCSQGGTVCNCLHGYTGNGCEIPPYYHTTTEKSSMYSC